VGAVRCSKHGTHVAGPSCCDHVRKAVAYAMAMIPYGIYRVDVLDDGTLIAGYMLCPECASQFGLAVDEVVSGEVWINEDRFPYVCPVCAQCFKEWSAQDLA
jgi:hypothetical protein